MEQVHGVLCNEISLDYQDIIVLTTVERSFESKESRRRAVQRVRGWLGPAAQTNGHHARTRSLVKLIIRRKNKILVAGAT